jgi:hypothetical protein
VIVKSEDARSGIVHVLIHTYIYIFNVHHRPWGSIHENVDLLEP